MRRYLRTTSNPADACLSSKAQTIFTFLLRAARRDTTCSSAIRARTGRMRRRKLQEPRSPKLVSNREGAGPGRLTRRLCLGEFDAQEFCGVGQQDFRANRIFQRKLRKLTEPALGSHHREVGAEEGLVLN